MVIPGALQLFPHAVSDTLLPRHVLPDAEVRRAEVL
jgi:hypothetical protein